MQPPGLDQQRWTLLWDRLGAQGDGLPIFGRLTAAYAERFRAYHTAEHIRDCLAQLDLAQKSAQRPDEIEAAIWFHDAVYLAGQADNEAKSADLASTTLLEAGVSPEVTDRIAHLILATRHANTPAQPDARLLCDIDLSVLGRAPEVFEEFERRIRREYAWVPERVYRSARTELLRGFLGRPWIYQTDYFRNLYEGQARTNIEGLIARLAG